MVRHGSAKPLSAKAAGIGGLGTHSLRHTYRSWLDSVGTPVGVQQKLMRHTDVRTTMRYGDAFTSDMAIQDRSFPMMVGAGDKRAGTWLGEVSRWKGGASCISLIALKCLVLDTGSVFTVCLRFLVTRFQSEEVTFARTIHFEINAIKIFSSVLCLNPRSVRRRR